MSDTEERMDIEDNDSNGVNNQHNAQPNQEVLNGTTQKKDSTTIHLNVMWPEGKHPPKWERELQKALQSWFNKNKMSTDCLSLSAQEHGSVKMEIAPASGQEDLFTQETELTLKDQTKVSVKRVIHTSLTPSTPPMPVSCNDPLVQRPDDFSSIPSYAPSAKVSCNIPLGHFWYVNQVYREKMKCIEKKNRVQIQPDVMVSFNIDPSTGGDPHKALSEFTDLVQSCLGDSNCFTYTHEQVDWEKTLKFIQQDQEKLTLTVSPHEVGVCGPMKSLKAFESITKMPKKITPIPGPLSAREAQGQSPTVNMNFRDPLLSSGLKIDPEHWVVITNTFKKQLEQVESRFGVTFYYLQDIVKAKAKMTQDAITLESHALRALLCLYQRVATSAMSCSLQSPSQVNILEETLSGLSGVVPNQQGDQWRIIGLPNNLCQAVDDIENNIGRPIFKDEDKQRIGHSRYQVEPRSNVASGKCPVGGATADDVEDKCPICLDSFKNKTTLKCTHMFCKECLEQSKRSIGPTCPLCKAILGTFIGDQPDGTMTWETQRATLPGFFDCGRILITYVIHPAKQTAKHPNPGQYHNGARRHAYLPDNPQGREVLRLLKRAFDQKLIFTVGTSRTSGSDNQVTWNDVHHKTSVTGGPQCFGYPDPDYLRRVKEELKAKGIE